MIIQYLPVDNNNNVYTGDTPATIQIARLSDKKYWDGADWQAAPQTLDMTQLTGSSYWYYDFTGGEVDDHYYVSCAVEGYYYYTNVLAWETADSVYATVSELVDYTGLSVSALPADVERLLQRASELIDYATQNSIDTTDTDHTAAARKATCAQVEYWIERGEDIDKGPVVVQETIGRTAFTYGGAISQLAPRAKRYLQLAGLLKRGVALV